MTGAFSGVFFFCLFGKTAAAAFAVLQLGQGTETLTVSFLVQPDNVATSGKVWQFKDF